MLQASHTPNMTGVLLSGEPEDFRILYDSLHKIVGNVGDELENESAIRILGVCYDIRHTFMGNRNATYIEHGFSDEQLAFLSLVGPKQNLNLAFETLWPEMLYVVFSLETFIRDYQKTSKATIWDPHVTQARILQSAIFKLVEETVTSRQFTSFKKWITENSVESILFTQYIDYLNSKWNEMDLEKRKKNFNIFAKRTCQLTPDYERQKRLVIEAAIEHRCHPSEIHFPSEFYSHLEW
ncbi:hypothetical protein EVJ27_02950 [Exiguobacterium sp. SH3S2]|uniref:DUF6904 family protein n=1 Tax=unclassified Exiguobacterium TaxID=2644629 RepID=UPI00103DC18B|nr:MULTISPECIES: hypothetical protein [unclassified Exiguobacterium]TCI27698.1 hypothetical protein EVJ32_00400 [Exiguobacterium sp. SH5S4]TCI48941.1 hypothetical protein EVJ28_02945 [Exiguobacterium sp. SH3S3]TCI53199.1 hypothetical protein EVJ30_08825 [Exiguobacterium sp. SH5S13]TCI63805.1 hypothetical protein EVJ27_02950 [Exiguobacterium sp. SH3S2]TCI64928.1 hypothetical protein EVJ26_03960 [Exiguobacterium sp. SH3S1]